MKPFIQEVQTISRTFRSKTEFDPEPADVKMLNVDNGPQSALND